MLLDHGELGSLLTNDELSQLFHAYDLALFMTTVKERLEPTKEFGPSHIGHPSSITRGSWHGIVSTSITVAPDSTMVMTESVLRSVADQSKVTQILIIL